MRTIMLAVSAAIFLLPVSANAARSVSAGNVTQFCGDRVCPGLSAPIQIRDRQFRSKRIHIAKRSSAKPRRAARHVERGDSGSCRRGTAALACVVAPLAAKAQAIVAACGSTVLSAHRPGARVRGSGHASLHAAYPAKAVDLQGNPACIYQHLHGWAGGYSTDYGRVKHVHVSYAPGGGEWGARFAHYSGGRHARTRLAHARHGGAPRYATALPPAAW